MNPQALKVVHWLRAEGHDVLAVAESMPQAEDVAILTRAVDERRVVVTNDKDFGELVFRSGQPHHGIVLLRLQDDNSANRVAVMKALLKRYESRLPEHFTVVTETSVRIRPTLIL